MKLILLGRKNWKKTESLLNMPEISAWGRSVSCLIASSHHTQFLGPEQLKGRHLWEVPQKEGKTCLTFPTFLVHSDVQAKHKIALCFLSYRKFYQVFFLFAVDVAMSDLGRALVFLYQKVSLEADTRKCLQLFVKRPPGCFQGIRPIHTYIPFPN